MKILLHATALAVPDLRKDKEAVDWRRRLITFITARPDRRIVRLFRHHEYRSQTERDDLAAIAKSPILRIEEPELAMLAICSAISDTHAREAKAIRSKLLGLLEKRRQAQTAWAHRSLDDVRAWLLRYPLVNIRAKLATLELIAGVVGEPLYLQLIALTPLYLRSAPVQDWLQRCRAWASFGSAEEKARARRALKQVHRAIQGDLRRAKPRRYPRFKLYRRAALIADKIREFRADDGEGCLNQLRFRRFLDAHDFTGDDADLILDPTKPVVETTLELLAAIAELPDATAFREFQAEIRRLAMHKQHADLLLDPVLNRFLDFPTMEPAKFAALNVWRVLDDVPIPDDD